MPRSNRPRGRRKASEPLPELNVAAARGAGKRIEDKNGVPCWVQPTSGRTDDGVKSWVCPNCTVPISQGTAHIVAWPADLDVKTRRHFHSNCWAMYRGYLG